MSACGSADNHARICGLVMLGFLIGLVLMRHKAPYVRAWVVWGMVLLALWGGAPSTACICANGSLKLSCSHRCVARHAHETGEQHGALCTAGSRGDEHACCCVGAHDEHVAGCEGEGAHDCCNSTEFGGPPGTGISSRGCCKPIESLVATLSSVVKAAAPFEASSAPLHTAARLFHGGHTASAHSWRGADTGPPVDLVVTLGRFLI
jgi:hypothetical protein